MMRTFFVILILAGLLPSGAHAATVAADDALTLSEASSGNAYLAGANVRVTAPVTGDVSALAADIIMLAPVSGDALLSGGTIEAGGSVGGDLRAFGGRISVKGNVAGDIFVAGGAVRISGTGDDLQAFGIDVEVTGGAHGPVTIYGSTVTLAGDFTDDVQVFASDRLTLLPSAHIRGALEYDAPQQADIQEGAVIDGDVAYTGSASFLPTKEEARTFAIAGAGLFLIIRILSGMLASALIAGLFPAFAHDVANRVLMRSPRKFILLTLLGFAIIVATPILGFFLALSFVGFGIALLMGAAYLLLLIIAFLTSGILVGAVLTRLILKRARATWRAALLGMLVLSLISLIPVIGIPMLVILSAASAGAIVASGYRFAFGHDTSEL